MQNIICTEFPTPLTRVCMCIIWREVLVIQNRYWIHRWMLVSAVPVRWHLPACSSGSTPLSYEAYSSYYSWKRSSTPTVIPIGSFRQTGGGKNMRPSWSFTTLPDPPPNCHNTAGQGCTRVAAMMVCFAAMAFLTLRTQFHKQHHFNVEKTLLSQPAHVSWREGTASTYASP